MRVRCKNLGGSDLGTLETANGRYMRSSIFHVTVGREYTVFGLLFSSGMPHYLICDDNDIYYDNDAIPVWHPPSMFAVTCDRVSRHWRVANWSNSEQYFVLIGYPEITESPEAYDRLVDADPAARYAFYKRKQLAELEFPDSSIEQVAQLIEGDWLQCPFCADAWQSNSLNALVRCPACRKISNDPRYYLI